ncbi:MAG: rRNA maturation RNase YbeY [Alphaproteobacteria bacterium]|nr:rRNA maturation RNase YbeY [Alphaproteobacteria bacterium]
MQVEIDIADENWRAIDGVEQIISAASSAAASALGGDVSKRLMGVRLAGNAEVQALNKQYRGKDKSTNILSFGADLDTAHWPPGEPLPLGDVILAHGVVHAEAEEFGKKIESHLMHLIVHGVLHLAGYDHEDAETADEMEALEVQILAGLGIENPYD